MALCAPGVKDPVPQGFFAEGKTRPQILPPLYHVFKGAKRVDVRFKEFAAFREAWYTRIVCEENESFLGISTTTWLAKCDGKWWPWDKKERPHLVAEPQLPLGVIADPSGAMASALAAHVQARREQEQREQRARALAAQMETPDTNLPISEAPALPLPSTRPAPLPPTRPAPLPSRPTIYEDADDENAVPMLLEHKSPRYPYTLPCPDGYDQERDRPADWDQRRKAFFEEKPDYFMMVATGQRLRELKDDAGQNFEWWYDYLHGRVLAFIRRPGDLIADECGGARGARKLDHKALEFRKPGEMSKKEYPDIIYPVPSDNKDGYNPPVSFFAPYLSLV